ncbi:hypothetical protein [Spirosoma luteum]|uniref:hypothetical protein n=1 Tax=Spirosoma luteum TaxID=431553 RepID=UPI00037BD72A|nr:hypothetical protein [Spirosoma luteum]
MAKAKQSDLLPLPAIRQLLKSCTTLLQPLTHQVSALPKETDLEYYFVPAEQMELFRPYYRPGKPFKNLKLVNFERPAISLTFYNKHKYKIDRGIKPDSAHDILKEQRDNLYARSFLDELTPGQHQKLQDIDSLLRAIRQSPDQFQFCVSNYHHYYRYWYCSFRYFEDTEEIKTGTANEHMLKHTQRTDERSTEKLINERLNIIFIDTKYITRPVPYDNKLIDRELETYTDRVNFGKAALYIRSAE